MNIIPQMRVFAMEDLANLLDSCYESLHHAYQKTMETDLWILSEEAYQASQYLLNEIHQGNRIIH